jgi:hypothetical protein
LHILSQGNGRFYQYLKKRRLPAKPDGLPASLRGLCPENAGLRKYAFAAKWLAAKKNDMRSEDLMKPDLLSEIVLLGSGALLFLSLLLVVVTALNRV